MAFEKRKEDILRPKINPQIKNYADAYCYGEYDEYKQWGRSGINAWWYDTDDDVEPYYDYDYDYYYDSNGVRLCSSSDINRIRQEKLEELFGDKKNPTIGDILRDKIQ